MNGENEQILIDCKQELQYIKTWIDHNPFDTNCRFLTAYAVVKACGSLELVLKRAICDYLIVGANEEASSYLTKCIIDASFNPSTGQVEHLLDKINVSWKTAFVTGTQGSEDKASLNSLVQLRNDIAHGRSISASINTINTYFDAGQAILQLLFSIIDGAAN